MLDSSLNPPKPTPQPKPVEEYMLEKTVEHANQILKENYELEKKLAEISWANVLMSKQEGLGDYEYNEDPFEDLEEIPEIIFNSIIATLKENTVEKIECGEEEGYIIKTDKGLRVLVLVYPDSELLPPKILLLNEKEAEVCKE